ncbi:MAG: hypothetical protein H6708_28180 [Kofleriaceae bacterium]|nr:hypothetical protein [Myxococcales bacterium]MCB9564280.1 hypothetical protein [Kofleriaceae bacterium]
MSWLDDINDTVSAGGAWLGDALGAAPSASAPHAAAPEAHTDQPAAEDRGFLDSIVHGVGELGRGLQQEGLGALVDPFGAIDRQEAQQELASRFNVVAPGAPGAGSQNTVTEEQFQEISRQYSDIRMGRSNLQLNTDGMTSEEADEFRRRSMADIGDILQTDSGRGLIGELSEGALDADGETHRVTRIGKAADVNSSVGGGRWNDDETHKRGHANYVPGENALPDSIDARSDVTLYHELVHAYQSTNNNWDTGTVGSDAAAPQDRGIDESEYQAAGLGNHYLDPYTENEYRRDRMDIGARGNGMRTLGGSDADMHERDYYNAPPS